MEISKVNLQIFHSAKIHIFCMESMEICDKNTSSLFSDNTYKGKDVKLFSF
jgi:hypothetical protein